MVAWWQNSYVGLRHSLVGQAGRVWSVAHRPAMRPSDAVAVVFFIFQTFFYLKNAGKV